MAFHKKRNITNWKTTLDFRVGTEIVFDLKWECILKHTIYFVFLYLFTRYDEVDEEVIYSQESPKMEESFQDFDWDLNRFVEYRSPFTRKETLLPIKKPI